MLFRICVPHGANALYGDCDVGLDIKCKVTYSQKVCADIGLTMWTTADMSKSTTVVCQTGSARPVGKLIQDTQDTISVFVPERSEPLSATLARSLWFSNQKKSAISASGCYRMDMKTEWLDRCVFCFWTQLPLLPFFLLSGRFTNMRMVLRRIVSDTCDVTFPNLCIVHSACRATST